MEVKELVQNLKGVLDKFSEIGVLLVSVDYSLFSPPRIKVLVSSPSRLKHLPGSWEILTEPIRDCPYYFPYRFRKVVDGVIFDALATEAEAAPYLEEAKSA
jgi:hypothetical protein